MIFANLIFFFSRWLFISVIFHEKGMFIVFILSYFFPVDKEY